MAISMIDDGLSTRFAQNSASVYAGIIIIPEQILIFQGLPNITPKEHTSSKTTKRDLQTLRRSAQTLIRSHFFTAH